MAQPHSPSTVNHPLKAEQTSRLAMTLMQQRAIVPTPENYIVWYHYVLSENKELVRQIDEMIDQNLPFDPTHCNYLYNKYIVGDTQQQKVEDAASDTNRMLAQVLKVVSEFKSETSNYNSDVDLYLEKVSGDMGSDANVQSVVKELIGATRNLRDSGQALTQKLEDSQKEIESLKKNLEKVTTESQRDFLTGVYNRKSLDQMMDEQMKLAVEEKKDLCMLLVDVDHFKKFNDKFGHLIGDEVLKLVARAMTDCVKGKDIVARYGGEEFAVLLPATPMKGGQIVAESIRSAIASKELKRKDTGENFGVITVSIGVSLYRMEEDTVPSFIKRADKALYASKRDGRNRVSLETP